MISVMKRSAVLPIMALTTAWATSVSLTFFAGEAPDISPLLEFLDVVFEHVAGHHRPAELGLVDGHEIDQLRPRALHRRHADGAGRLRYALDDQHARHHRPAGKMAGEVWLVEGDVLDPDGGFVAVDIDDAVDHQERVAVRQKLQDALDVE
jgi:translation initiation factor IF-1